MLFPPWATHTSLYRLWQDGTGFHRAYIDLNDNWQVHTTDRVTHPGRYATEPQPKRGRRA